MRKRLGSFIRHNAIGLIALMVALSGVAYAAAPKNSVTSKSIKDKSVKTLDLADSAVTSLQVADDSVGDSDISNLSAASIDLGVHAVLAINSGAADTATASCPPGEVALGGGGEYSTIIGDAGALEISKPIGTGVTPPLSPPTGWQVRYENGISSPGILAWAICMPT